ncbi:hypothetical protein NE865_07717 [Phthorimaea operculella]|nr:hypothetical protein NE865_07717 [Phthorimaea operculella]
MSKRSAEELLVHYEKKIKKIKESEERRKMEEHRRRIRRIIFDSSDDENAAEHGAAPIAGPSNQSQDQNIRRSVPQNAAATPPATAKTTEPPASARELNVADAPTTSTETPAAPTQASAASTGATAATTMSDTPVSDTPVSDTPLSETPASTSDAAIADVSLDPDLLSALGAATSDTPEFGENIHASLANLGTPLLKKGLPKEDKDKLLRNYLVPGNCRLLQAPKLNAEISAAVAEVVRGRDKKLCTFQQQLGTGTSAINKAMNTLLTSDDKILALKYLSDSCRILSDLHYCLSKDRIKLITPSLEKNFLHVIQDTERDETLFGSTLETERTTAIFKPSCPGKLVRTSSLLVEQGGARRPEEATVDSTAYVPPGTDTSEDHQLQSVEGSCTSPTVAQTSSSPTQQTYPGCRQALREAFKRRGSPVETLDLMSLNDSVSHTKRERDFFLGTQIRETACKKALSSIHPEGQTLTAEILFMS